jgi:vacuolar protein sorting-associated protein 26
MQNKLFGNLGLGASCTVQLDFKASPSTSSSTQAIAQKSITVTDKKGQRQSIPCYTNKDTITGEVKVYPTPGKRVDHQGIRVQLVGEIELVSERGHPHEFLSLVRDVAPPGDLFSAQTFPFEFRSVEMEYESYKGTQVRLRYLLRVTVVRGLGQTVTKEYPFWVQNPTSLVENLSLNSNSQLATAGTAVSNNNTDLSPAQPGALPPIKMEVGIEECLHIEFEYNKGTYHLKDTVVGKIYFLLVRIKLKHMELEIRRRETIGGGTTAKVETETVAKYEIMDGAPVRGEVIPIRLHLAPYDLTPSYPNVHNKYGVKYSINLVLVDEEDRRYFKQQEITLIRLPEESDCSNGGGGGGTENNDGGGSSNGARDGRSSSSGPQRVMAEPVLTPRTAGKALSREEETTSAAAREAVVEEQLVTPEKKKNMSGEEGKEKEKKENDGAPL